MTDFETWVLDHKDRIYRYWVHRRIFTPYEQEQKFTDESCFVCNECSFGCIKEAVELPDGDILLGFIDPADYGTSIDGYIDFYKLSEIHLEYSPLDKEEYVNEDD